MTLLWSIVLLDKSEEKVCRKCGEVFDWDGLKVTKVNVCPSCNKEYEADDEYCEDHIPPVKLEKRYQ